MYGDSKDEDRDDRDVNDAYYDDHDVLHDDDHDDDSWWQLWC